MATRNLANRINFKNKFAIIRMRRSNWRFICRITDEITMLLNHESRIHIGVQILTEENNNAYITQCNMRVLTTHGE